MKKIICVFLCLMFCLSISFPVMANDFIQTDSISLERDSYAQEIIKTYIELSTDVLESDVLNISQAFAICNLEENYNRIYFLFKNNLCIGQLSVAYIDDRFTSTFFSYDIPVITDAYKNAVPFVLLADGESLFFVSQNSVDLLNGPSVNSEIFDKLASTPNINNAFSTINLSSISCTISSEEEVLVSDELILDVIYRSNYELSTGTGICWAACDASIGEYYTGTRLTAYQLYTYLAELHNGQPEGNEIWKKRLSNIMV